MGKNLQKQFSFRTDDDIIQKINYIADYNTRTRNKEIEHLLKRHIKDFEEEHGKLIIEENGAVIISKEHSKNKLSESKIG